MYWCFKNLAFYSLCVLFGNFTVHFCWEGEQRRGTLIYPNLLPGIAKIVYFLLALSPPAVINLRIVCLRSIKICMTRGQRELWCLHKISSLEAGSLSGRWSSSGRRWRMFFMLTWGSLDANKGSRSADAMLSLLVRALGFLAETKPMLPYLCWVNVGHWLPLPQQVQSLGELHSIPSLGQEDSDLHPHHLDVAFSVKVTRESNSVRPCCVGWADHWVLVPATETFSVWYQNTSDNFTGTLWQHLMVCLTFYNLLVFIQGRVSFPQIEHLVRKSWTQDVQNSLCVAYSTIDILLLLFLKLHLYLHVRLVLNKKDRGSPYFLNV